MKKIISTLSVQLFFAIIAVIPLNTIYARDLASNVLVEATINSTEAFKEIIIRKLGTLRNNETAEFKITIVDTKFKGSFHLDSYGFYNISDIWAANTIFIKPNNSLKIDLKLHTNDSLHLLTTFTLSSAHKLWRDLLFFDMLALKKGYIKYILLDSSHSTPVDYKTKLR